jgi:uncharacterized protein
MSLVLITGANGGIGSALAKEFAANGHDLLLHARNKDSLADVASVCKKSGVKVYVVGGDLSKSNAASALYADVKKQGLKVTHLVNNAGFGDFGLFEHTDIAKIHDIMTVNMVALTELTHEFLPGIIKAKGGVLNVASIVSFFPGPLMSVYYASKAYVLSFSNALAEELAGRVVVTALCPGVTKSGFQKSADLSKSRISKGYMMSTEQVAKAAYKGFMNGKMVVTPGLPNKINTILPRFIPRQILVKIIHRAQSE